MVLMVRHWRHKAINIFLTCIISFPILMLIFLTTGEHSTKHHEFITRQPYDWQLVSELPCLGWVPLTRSDAKELKQSNDDSDDKKKTKKYKKMIERYEKCNSRNPDSVKDSNSVLIRNRGYYNINFESCYDDFKLHDESGKLTLETSCNWYWCASHEGCVRRPQPNYGSKCTSGEANMMISVFVICISFAIFGMFFLFDDSRTSSESKQLLVDNCFCIFPQGWHETIYQVSTLILVIAVIFSVPATVLFSIAMTECDQVYPFPVVFELFNQTSQSNSTDTPIHGQSNNSNSSDLEYGIRVLITIIIVLIAVTLFLNCVDFMCFKSRRWPTRSQAAGRVQPGPIATVPATTPSPEDANPLTICAVTVDPNNTNGNSDGTSSPIHAMAITGETRAE